MMSKFFDWMDNVGDRIEQKKNSLQPEYERIITERDTKKEAKRNGDATISKGKRSLIVFLIIFDVIIAAALFLTIIGIPFGAFFAWNAHRNYEKHIKKAGA